MRCPMGQDHPATWRCLIVFAVDWVLDRIPERWPLWTRTPLFRVLLILDPPLVAETGDPR